MRASRLVSIILLLQARGRMTAEQLASELEVSVRTIYGMSARCTRPAYRSTATPGRPAVTSSWRAIGPG